MHNMVMDQFLTNHNSPLYFDVWLNHSPLEKVKIWAYGGTDAYAVELSLWLLPHSDDLRKAIIELGFVSEKDEAVAVEAREKAAKRAAAKAAGMPEEEVAVQAEEEAAEPDRYTQFVHPDDPSCIRSLSRVLKGFLRSTLPNGEPVGFDLGGGLTHLDRLADLVDLFAACQKCIPSFVEDLFMHDDPVWTGTVGADSFEQTKTLTAWKVRSNSSS